MLGKKAWGWGWRQARRGQWAEKGTYVILSIIKIGAEDLPGEVVLLSCSLDCTWSLMWLNSTFSVVDYRFQDIWPSF